MSELTEDTFLSEQSDVASKALTPVMEDVKRDLKGVADPRGWTRQYPWAAVGMAAATGLAAVVSMSSRRSRSLVHKSRDPKRLGSKSRRRPARRIARSSIKRSVLSLVRNSVLTTIQSAVVAGLTTKSVQSNQESNAQNDSGHSNFVPLYARSHQGGGGQRTAGSVTSASDKRSRASQHDSAPATRSWWALIKQTCSDWSEDKVPRLGAALAYYTVFSLAPILIIALAIAGLFNADMAQKQVNTELQGFLGKEGATAVSEMIQGAQKPAQGTVATILGVGALIFGASGFFGQLKDSMNTIWEVEPKPDRGILGTIKDRFLSFTMVLGVAFMLLVSLVISTALTAVGDFVGGLLPGEGWEVALQVGNVAISLIVITLLFALIFKYLPDVQIGWRDVWIGAAATAVLFVIGKYLFGLYLSQAAPQSSYGAVGALVVVLLWAYYSSQILFFGAEFTQAYARMYGSRIVPSPEAQPVTEEARAQQGIPRKSA